MAQSGLDEHAQGPSTTTAATGSMDSSAGKLEAARVRLKQLVDSTSAGEKLSLAYKDLSAAALAADQINEADDAAASALKLDEKLHGRESMEVASLRTILGQTEKK